MNLQRLIDQHPSVFCGDLSDLLSFPVAFGGYNHQLRRRVVLAVEGLSHTSSVRQGEMGRSERTDAVARELTRC